MGSLILGWGHWDPNRDPNIGGGTLRSLWGPQYWGEGIETPVRSPVLGWGH